MFLPMTSCFPYRGLSGHSGSGARCPKSVEKVLSAAGPGKAPGADRDCGKDWWAILQPS